MTALFLFAQADIISFIKNFVLAVSIIGFLLLPVILAEGCVKRPRLEPSPGVSQTDVSSGRQHLIK